jgi:hypothetical protein
MFGQGCSTGDDLENEGKSTRVCNNCTDKDNNNNNVNGNDSEQKYPASYPSSEEDSSTACCNCGQTNLDQDNLCGICKKKLCCFACTKDVSKQTVICSQDCVTLVTPKKNKLVSKYAQLRSPNYVTPPTAPVFKAVEPSWSLVSEDGAFAGYCGHFVEYHVVPNFLLLLLTVNIFVILSVSLPL